MYRARKNLLRWDVSQLVFLCTVFDEAQVFINLWLHLCEVKISSLSRRVKSTNDVHNHDLRSVPCDHPGTAPSTITTWNYLSMFLQSCHLRSIKTADVFHYYTECSITKPPPSPHPVSRLLNNLSNPLRHVLSGWWVI